MVTRGEWAQVCAATWGVMAGTLLAAAPLLADRMFTLKLVAVLVVGLPVCLSVHASRISRWKMNLGVFLVSVGLGTLELCTHWPYQTSSDSPAGPLALLLRFFLWVMVFRSVAVRTLTDAVQTAIPAVSILLLVLIVQPEPQALLGVALVALGTIALLAREHQALDDAASDAIARVRVRTGNGVRVRARNGASVYAWPTLYLVVMIAAVATGVAASYLHFSSQLGQDVQIMLARKLATYMMRDSWGYVPDNRIVLDGRTPRNSDRLLFQVKAEIPVNWRTTAYEKYNGRTWTRYRYRGQRATPVTGGWRVDPSTMPGFNESSTTRTSFDFTADVPLGGILPAAIWPTELESMVSGLRSDDVGALLVTGYIMPGQQYHLEARIPSLNPSTESRGKPKLPPSVRARCLEVPDSVPDRVRELARGLVVSETQTLGKVIAIQSYLQRRYPYDLSPPMPGPGDDFVDHFLFVGQRGYCHHFASAMVILCRCVGLPTRLAVGFTEGEYDATNDRYLVREKDMHSWAEVFLDDRGWMPFDSTPPEDERNRSTLTVALQSIATHISDGTNAAWDFLGRSAASLMLLAIGLVAASTGAHVVTQQRRWAVRAPERRASPRDRCLFAYRQMRRWLVGRGLAASADTAPLEYVGVVRDKRPELELGATGVTEAYLAARFSAVDVPEGLAVTAEAALTRLREALRSSKSG